MNSDYIRTSSAKIEYIGSRKSANSYASNLSQLSATTSKVQPTFVHNRSTHDLTSHNSKHISPYQEGRKDLPTEKTKTTKSRRRPKVYKSLNLLPKKIRSTSMNRKITLASK